MKNELPKVYSPKDFEDRLYQFWLDNNLFAPQGEGEPFVIAIPPPNVTGVLHMGHGLNNSLQDLVIRYQRMKGRKTLWIPGTDHAGIATQQVVERRLKAEGKHRRDLGREKFVELTWQVKEEHHAQITKQLKKIGASVDWNRERFTLDEGLSKAVKHVFVDLYKKGLVYKGLYLVNWDPEAQTAIADDEVEFKEVSGHLYHIRYPFADGSGWVELATTRPETLIGDAAVAVHPEDERYFGKTGKMLKLPIADREIPLMADAFVDREFGTGAVKITPAHDKNDFDMGRRHGLPQINILNPDGTLGPNVPDRYKGLSVKEARKKIIQELKTLDLFIKEEPHKHQVGHCYRSGAVIEPYLSEQWFVKMQPLADKAMQALTDGEIRFFPQRWENTYTNWLTNIRDWCISRQLWWGHQIPAWNCSCGEVIVAEETPTTCPKCGGKDLKQEEDVLDTWFSSWLWPFSTLGWPEKTQDMVDFYPTTALVTAFDIIFFWVARMIMAGKEFTGKAPFKDIYIHQLVRDKQGRKMSKSIGNGIDPLEVVEEFGADAMKFTLAYLAAQGQDILMDKEGFKLGSKFANKIWNASRYIMMNLPEMELPAFETLKLKEMDQWILHRFDETVEVVDKAMAEYKFNEAAHAVYDYFWYDFCDWYIEATKLDLYSADPILKAAAASKLVTMLQENLKLLHPFLPFITEEISLALPGHPFSLVTTPFPKLDPQRRNPDLGAKMGMLQDMVREVRTLRSEFIIPPETEIDLSVKLAPGAATDYVLAHGAEVKMYMTAGQLDFEGRELEGSVGLVGKGWEARVAVKHLVDVPKQQERLRKDIAKFETLIKGLDGRLNNEKFVQGAPVEIVAAERAKRAEWAETMTTLKVHLKDLD
ncbi:MAG: valine--tRNA ligase [Spirochaetes bacterium GWB1_48_6]|nr:MAG: valine--tRNA ligase [Spirochaetes bacterium GWB1_48_6]